MNSLTPKPRKVYYSLILIQICLLIISLSCFYVGSVRLYLGAPNLSQSIDNSLRFYASGFMAIGFLAIWVATTVKRQNNLIFFFAFFVLMSGLGRLISIIDVGLPNNTYLFYLSIDFLLPLIMIITQIYLNKNIQ